MNASFYEKCVTVHPYQTIGSGRGAPEQQDWVQPMINLFQQLLSTVLLFHSGFVSMH
jgi:hypothetical protein